MSIENQKEETLVLTRDIKNLHILINRSGVNRSQLNYNDLICSNKETNKPCHYRLVANLNSCLKQLHSDVYLYGNILHTILYSFTIVLLIYCYNSLNREAFYNCFDFKSDASKYDHWFHLKILKIFSSCKSHELNYSILICILIFNILTFILVLFDKYQAYNLGYRVKESLLIILFHAGGFPVGWVLLLHLNHKIFSFKFVFLALLATVSSFLLQYVYFIFK